MRIKILSIIARLLILPLAITSCLNSNDNYVPGSDDLITSFALDMIYGKNYKFTIDQYGNAEGTVGLIYNIDSLPFGSDTIINKIPIKTITTAGYVTSGETILKDTVFVASDSLDLSNTMVNPLVIRVRSADGNHVKEYRIEVRRHLTVPDSLVWWNGSEQEPVTESFSGGAVTADQETKSVLLGDHILVFTFDGTNIVGYKGAETGSWPKITTSNLPSGAKISSIINFSDILYTVTESGAIYSSTDGSSWVAATSRITGATGSSKVTRLLTTFSGDPDSNGNTVDAFISGIIQEDNGTVFAIARKETDGSLTWTKGNRVPEEFPTANISATKSFKTTTVQRAVLIGTPNEANATATITWFSETGLTWAQMETKGKYSLPNMERPSIIYYGKKWYVFGDDFSAIYTSSDKGLVWTKVEENFLFPSDKDTDTPIFEGRGSGYCMVVDKENYIWMIWNKGATYSDQVWRGKQNKLSFLIQD